MAASTMEIESGFPRAPIWISLAIIVYLGFNLLCALWATVRGLKRRKYREVAYDDLVPRAGEGEVAYRNRILSGRLVNARWNDWVVNEKVSELDVAHAAVGNALSATACVIAMALVIALLRLA